MVNRRQTTDFHVVEPQFDFSVAAIDQRCEEWMKKTPEEKEAFIKDRKEMMEKFHKHAGFFGYGRGFGFGCHEENAKQGTDAK